MGIYRSILKRFTKSTANLNVLPVDDEILVNTSPISVRSLEIDLIDYGKWVDEFFPDHVTAFGTKEHKKLLELYVSWSLLEIEGEHVYMDAAGGKFSYVGKITASRKIMQDIDFAQEVIDSAGTEVEFIKCSAAKIDLEDSSVDRISCHHSIEHFQQNADVDFMNELQRILKPRGKAVIIPIFISDKHYLITDLPNFKFWKEEGEILVDRLAGLPGGPRSGNFSRVYSIDSLQSRLLDAIDTKKFKCSIVQVKYDGKSVPNESSFFSPNQARTNFNYRALEISRIG